MKTSYYSKARTIKYTVLVLVIITLISVAYSSIVTITPEFHIPIPEDVLKKDDLRDLVLKDDIFDLAAKDDLKDVINEADINGVRSIIEGVKTKVDLIEETLEVDRNIGGFISGLRQDEKAIIEATRFEWDPSGLGMIKLDSCTIESENGWWEIHYLTPGQYELTCNASGYVSYPRSYLDINVPDDDLPWSIRKYEFTMYLPEEAASKIPTIDIPDHSLGGYVLGLQEGDYVTITVSSDEKVFHTTSGNGWWRINALGNDYFTVKVEASGYTSSPESYYKIMVPDPISLKADWTRLDLNFTMSPLPDWQIENAQYVDMFQEQPELFKNYTSRINVIFESQDGSVMGELTGILRFIRFNQSLNVTFEISLRTEPIISEINLQAGAILLLFDGWGPVPIPYPISGTYTLHNGESVTIRHETFDFDLDWEYIHLIAKAGVARFEIKYSDGNKWRCVDAKWPSNLDCDYWLPKEGPHLFRLLHNNPVETRTITLNIE